MRTAVAVREPRALQRRFRPRPATPPSSAPRSGTARPRARPPAPACGAPRRRTRSSTPSGGRPPSAVSEAGTSTALSGSTQVGRGRALAEQHDVLRARQRRARHDRARHARRPQPVGEPVAGAQVVGDEVARAAARARPPRRSRSAAGPPRSTRSAQVRCRTSASCSASRRPDPRRNSAHGPSGCRQRYCVGDSSVMRWKRPATRLGSVRSGRRQDGEPVAR